MPLAFHGDAALKQAQLDRIKNLKAAGKLHKNGVSIWGDGSKEKIATILSATRVLGFPYQVLHLHDLISNRLSESDAAEFSEQFLQAIQPGANLSGVMRSFAAWRLDDPTYGVIRFVESDAGADAALCSEVRNAILQLAQMYRSNCDDRWQWQNISTLTFKVEVKAIKAELAEKKTTRGASSTTLSKVAFAARYVSAAACDISGESESKDAHLHAAPAIIQRDKLLELLRAAN